MCGSMEMQSFDEFPEHIRFGAKFPASDSSIKPRRS